MFVLLALLCFDRGSSIRASGCQITDDYSNLFHGQRANRAFDSRPWVTIATRPFRAWLFVQRAMFGMNVNIP
jgi:hypothetical protein